MYRCRKITLTIERKKDRNRKNYIFLGREISTQVVIRTNIYQNFQKYSKNNICLDFAFDYQ